MAVDRPLPGAPATRGRARTIALDRPLTAGLVLGGLLLVAMTVRILLTRGYATPWIMIDELIYSEFAKSLADTGEWLNREQPSAFISLYPLLIAPAWLADSLETTFALAKGINGVLMTLAAVPVFFWARRLMPTVHAAGVALLVLLLPAFVLTGMLMTENAFFPSFLLALFALAVALERPTVIRQGAALGAAALALSMRYQGLVLMAILPSAIILRSLLEVHANGTRGGRVRLLGRELLRFWPILGLLVAGAVGYVLLQVARGQPLQSGLNAYSVVADVSYSAQAVFDWTVLHFAELVIVTAVAPFSAFLLLLILSLHRGFATTAAERAFLATAAVAVLWVTLQAGAFASEFGLRVGERNLFHVAPLCFMAFGLWVARGAPRPLLPTLAAVITPVALLLYLARENPLGLYILGDTFSLVPVLELGEIAGVDWRWRLVVIGGGLLVAMFALVPGRWVGSALGPALAAGLLAMSIVTYGRVTDHAEAVRGVPAVGDEVSWVDDALGEEASVAFLYTSNIDPNAVWQLEFWNRALGPIFNIGVPEISHLPQTYTSVDHATGELVPVPGYPAAAGSAGAEYILTARTHPVVGRLAAQRGPWTVYLADPPLRLAATTDGIAADGWMGADAAYTHYAAGTPGGNVGVRLSRVSWQGPDVRGRIRIRIGELALNADGAPTIGRITATRTGEIHSGGEETFLLPAPRSPFRLEVHIDPTFSPADFGFPDTRELGAIASFIFFEEEA